MSDTYTGQADDKRYAGTQADILYGVKRCIHAAHCVNRLASVFDVEKRPWVNADGASTDELMAAVLLCPSGALHVERKDGGAAEAPPDTNTIIVWHNGPLQIKGDVAIQAAGVDIQHETRATLCRCGASESKPFCDNAHKKIGFEAQEIDPVGEDSTAETGGGLTITAHENGPLEVEGNFRIETEDGTFLRAGSKTWLCRCGNSKSKPFCDGTHKTIGFEAD